MIARAAPRFISRTVEAAATSVRRGLVRAVIGTDELDRYDTVILPDGVDFASYDALGRPICYEHGLLARGLLPVGHAESLEKTTFKNRRSILVEVRFSDDDEFSRQIGERYRSKTMRAWSIHAKPIKAAYGRPTRDEIRAHPDWEAAQTVYRRSELLEISVVSVPGNASTLTTDVLRSGSAHSTEEAQIRRIFAEAGERIDAATIRQAAAYGRLARLLLEHQLAARERGDQ
jgi:hypothetical protein